MPFAVLRIAASFIAASAAVPLAPAASANPDIAGLSAATVIVQLQQQGYDVQVNGAPAGDTSLLSTCKVTLIHDLDDPPDDPSTTKIYVDVACPISHG